MGAKFYLLIFALFMALLTLQAIHYVQFQDEVSRWIHKCARFTAADGQALCERVQKLEKEPQECQYLNRAK